VAANQSNAQKSTGPKIAEGKGRASLNALKHGAYAKTDYVRQLSALPAPTLGYSG
jgi:hypothetical protein